MELLLGLVALIFSLGFLFDKAKELVQQLKSGNSVKLNKGFEAKLSVVHLDKKEEDVATTTPSTND